MSDGKLAVGAISWVDLTVADAPGVRDFSAAVTGWKPSPRSRWGSTATTA